ncbi:MAG: hypothetical protein IPL46_21745 [Saprospiraceae bacterium]|nr:hypothetical protein [Saprospiraceae bacterium]
MAPSPTPKQLLDTFDHVVVLMLENRSFDNLLGKLYPEGAPAGKSYAGLQSGIFLNPVPKRANESDKYPDVGPLPAQDYFQPFPDPGEVYQHVNTQLWNQVDPDNIGVDESKMKDPYNIPEPTPSATMNGFVNDYQNTLIALDPTKYPDYANPDYEHYSVIMQTYSTNQVKVMSTLAKQFAVFDHWFCSVPSQTWCNRAFWHASTSGGRVINPLGEGGWSFSDWRDRVWSQGTIFDRLEAKKISWNVYAPLVLSSLTYLIHGLYLKYPFHLHGFSKFQNHIDEGKLPQYSFLEPKYFGQHNDQHPSSIGKGVIDYKTKIGSVILGEKLIYDVYNAIKNSDYQDNTLLIITHDEHGGCFDHIVPGKTVSPDNETNTEKSFDFQRLGVRVPMIMISSHIQPNTIMSDAFEHTSFISTLNKKWDTGFLTKRDPTSRTFESVFTLEKRASWPDIAAPNIPDSSDDAYQGDPLNDLQKSIIYGISQVVDQVKGSRIGPDILTHISTNAIAMAYLEAHKETLGIVDE